MLGAPALQQARRLQSEAPRITVRAGAGRWAADGVAGMLPGEGTRRGVSADRRERTQLPGPPRPAPPPRQTPRPPVASGGNVPPTTHRRPRTSGRRIAAGSARAEVSGRAAGLRALPGAGGGAGPAGLCGARLGACPARRGLGLARPRGPPFARAAPGICWAPRSWPGARGNPARAALPAKRLQPAGVGVRARGKLVGKPGVARWWEVL